MNRVWLNNYPKGVPADIDPNAYGSVVDMLDSAMKQFADKIAFRSFGSALTYAEVDARARDFAAFLQKRLGVNRGDRIAVMTPNVLAFPLAMIGILRAGGVQVNVNPLYTPHELRHQLNDAGVETIVIFSGSTPTLAEVIDETGVKNVISVDLGDGGDVAVPSPACDPRIASPLRFADALAEGRGLDFEPVALSGDDLLFLQYTGGTTGLSKGATLTHRNLIANTEQFKAFASGAMRPGEEVVITALPLYHVFALMVNFITYFSVGAENVLIANPRDMGGFVDTLKRHPFSVFTGVNTLFGGLLMHPDFAKLDFSNFRVAFGGGAPVLAATSAKWRQITGHDILEGYGLSETSPILTLNPMGKEGFSGTVGLPMPSTEIKLLDENDNETAPGEAGEVCARGPQVMQGYWNRPDATADAFTEDGFFRTGDVGMFDGNGCLRIVDRKKDMILVSGFNVYPNEIEAVAAHCNGVVECAAIGVADERTGEAVRLFVVAQPEAGLDETAVMEHCRAELAGYKVPRQIRFVDALPKSTVGKILRRELRDAG